MGKNQGFVSVNLSEARDNSTWAVSWLAELTVTPLSSPSFHPLSSVSVCTGTTRTWVKKRDKMKRRWKGEWKRKWREEKRRKRWFFFEKNVSEPSNPPDELTQNVSKKIPFVRIIPPFVCRKVQNVTVFFFFFSFFYMIRIRFFGPGELIQNGFRAAQYSTQQQWRHGRLQMGGHRLHVGGCADETDEPRKTCGSYRHEYLELKTANREYSEEARQTATKNRKQGSTKGEEGTAGVATLERNTRRSIGK